MSARLPERQDDRVLVVGDEGVRHPGDPEERDHRDHARAEDRRGRDVGGLHVGEDEDERRGGEHDHLDQRGDRHRLDAPALGGHRRADAPRRPNRQIVKDTREEDRDAALREGQEDDVGRGRRRLHFPGGQAALVLDVVVELHAVAAHDDRHREDPDPGSPES